MKIPMPSPDEKRRSIDVILRSVPEAPISFIKTARGMMRLLGLRGLFFGVGDAAFIALMSVIISGASVFGLVKPGGSWNGMFYGVLFLFSPLTYMLLYSLTAWKERITGVWEVNNTCRFTTRHLTAVRMLCFSGAGMVICALLSLAFALYTGVGFLKLFGLTLCSLFLFAAIFMLLMLRLRELPAQAACVGLWCILCVVFCAGEGSFLKSLLDSLPVIVLFIAAASFLVLFMVETRAYFMKKGEKNYAVG